MVDLDTFLKTMAKKEKWEPPDVKSLTGKKYQGLTELRWNSGRVPYRIIGYVLADHVYVMLIGCTHNNRQYHPPSALNTAVERQSKILNGEARICEYKIITAHGDERESI